jgi:hypothetical protein
MRKNANAKNGDWPLRVDDAEPLQSKLLILGEDFLFHEKKVFSQTFFQDKRQFLQHVNASASSTFCSFQCGV